MALFACVLDKRFVDLLVAHFAKVVLVEEVGGAQFLKSVDEELEFVGIGVLVFWVFFIGGFFGDLLRDFFAFYVY